MTSKPVQNYFSPSRFPPVPFIYIGGELWEGRKKALWPALVRSNQGLERSNKGKKKEWKKNAVETFQIWEIKNKTKKKAGGRKRENNVESEEKKIAQGGKERKGR